MRRVVSGYVLTEEIAHTFDNRERRSANDERSRHSVASTIVIAGERDVEKVTYLPHRGLLDTL
jgi:hypothetical protein